MKKKSKTKNQSTPALDPYLEGLMGKLLERLTNLEKKMDLVIAQTSGNQASSKDQPKNFQHTASPPGRRDRTLYEAICAECHKVCEVPFKPSEDRAVYCKECFARRKSRNTASQMPVLTPVSMPARVSGSPQVASPAPTATASKPEKKQALAKKAKKKK